MSWTDKSTNLLKTLWKENYSLADIVKKIGKVSPKAVLAKANDLGLKKKRIANLKIDKPKVLSNQKRYQLFELSDRMCKWPTGDPKEEDFSFCGSECYEALPYCPEHAFAAYHSVTKKKLQKSGIEIEAVKEKRQKKIA